MFAGRSAGHSADRTQHDWDRNWDRNTPSGFDVEATHRNAAAKHHEVARRYAWQARQDRKSGRTNPNTRARLITLIRLRELERLYLSRWGRFLPDDDAGRDDLIVAAHHVAQMRGEIVKHIVCWASLWAPWMPQAEAEALAEKVAAAPRKYNATTLGWRLRLTDNERTALRITTIRAFDVSADEMAERRKQRDRERKANRRRLNRLGKPEPISRQMPWRTQGISRATWYRRRKVENKTTCETKCVRSIEKNIAADRTCLTSPGRASSETNGCETCLMQ